MLHYADFTPTSSCVPLEAARMSLSFPSHALSTADRLTAVRGAVSSAWHGLWQAASSSPWIAVGVTVPAVVLLVACARVSARRGG